MARWVRSPETTTIHTQPVQALHYTAAPHRVVRSQQIGRCINLCVVAISNACADAKPPLQPCQAPAPCRFPPSTMGKRSLLHGLRGEAWHRRSPRLLGQFLAHGVQAGASAGSTKGLRCGRWYVGGRAAANVPVASAPPATGPRVQGKHRGAFMRSRSPSKATFTLALRHPAGATLSSAQARLCTAGRPPAGRWRRAIPCEPWPNGFGV